MITPKYKKRIAPEEIRSFIVLITDLRINSVSVLDEEGTYSLTAGQTVEIDFEVRKAQGGQIAPSNANPKFVLAGLFNTQPKVFTADFTAGLATASFTLSEGVYQLDDEGINFPVRNRPDLQLEFTQKTVFVVQ